MLIFFVYIDFFFEDVLMQVSHTASLWRIENVHIVRYKCYINKLYACSIIIRAYIK